MAKTPEKGKEIQKEPEEPQQNLQEYQDENQPVEDDLRRVTVEPYFPEVSLG
jgi:hypothetical protein